MPRHIEKGLSYICLDVDFFQDRKISRLQRHTDPMMPVVYIALVLYICREGYYIKWDEETVADLAEFARLPEEYVNDGIMACLDKGLLSRDMFDRHSVLTSHGIQRQYAFVCERNKRKCRIEEYSLLEEAKEEIEDETRDIPGYSAKNSEEIAEYLRNPGNPLSTPQKTSATVKYSKVKESKEYSSFILPSYEEEINEEEKEEEKIVQYFFFEKNWPAAREEYYKLVAYNNTPAVKKKWDDLTAQEKMSLAMLWHQEPQRPQRFDAGFLAMWRKVYVVLARDAPWAIRMAALDDKLNVTYSKTNYVLRLPAALQAFMEEHIDYFKPVIWPEIQRHECGRLVYVPY